MESYWSVRVISVVIWLLVTLGIVAVLWFFITIIAFLPVSEDARLRVSSPGAKNAGPGISGHQYGGMLENFSAHDGVGADTVFPK